MRFFRALKRAASDFNRTTPRLVKGAVAFMLSILILASTFAAVDEYRELKFKYSSPATHLRVAENILREHSNVSTPDDNEQLKQAVLHLEAVPSTAAEYKEAQRQLSLVRNQEEIRQRQEEIRQRQLADREKNQRQLAWERASGNMQGTYHDPFTCSDSTENKPIMSFDNGTTWWLDDGRCAARQQKKRDEAAQASSYWSTTLRVDTDIDSSWLNNEERTCQTYPGEKGRVSVVACNASVSHRTHNIPVKFWGGVDRNTVSNWKCRREGDDFVCRAID
jgi:hypothetical protein